MDLEQYEQWAIKKLVLLVLSSAQRHAATEVVLTERNEAHFRVDGAWQTWNMPNVSWRRMTSEICGLAGIREKPFQKEGIVYVAYSGVRIRFRLQMTNEHECALQNLGNALV